MSQSNQPIVARADRTYRIRRGIFVLAIVGFGFFFLYDGFIGYPKQNAKIDTLTADREKARQEFRKLDAENLTTELDKLGKKKEEFDILLQQIIGFALIPLGAGLFLMFRHFSRGEYRLEGTKLSAPGHPTIDLTDIESVDYSKWKKKGLAWLNYKVGDKAGTILLDDDKYDRPKIDAIYDVVAKSMGITSDDASSDSASSNGTKESA